MKLKMDVWGMYRRERQYKCVKDKIKCNEIMRNVVHRIHYVEEHVIRDVS